jgi:lipoxygenase homology domain-containing protein 1
MAQYRIVVVTGTVDYAGTDSNVYITMYGRRNDNRTNSRERLLDNSEDNFEKGRTDTFAIETRDLGDLTRIRIRHDDTGRNSGWFLDRVTITNEDNGREWVFPCNRWLAIDEDDGQIARVLSQG